MLSKIARTAVLCAAATCLIWTSGCCGVCGGVCETYQHPCPSRVGLRYAGCCTCKDDCRDRVNQITDIFSP